MGCWCRGREVYCAQMGMGVGTVYGLLLDANKMAERAFADKVRWSSSLPVEGKESKKATSRVRWGAASVEVPKSAKIRARLRTNDHCRPPMYTKLRRDRMEAGGSGWTRPWDGPLPCQCRGHALYVWENSPSYVDRSNANAQQVLGALKRHARCYCPRQLSSLDGLCVRCTTGRQTDEVCRVHWGPELELAIPSQLNLKRASANNEHQHNLIVSITAAEINEFRSCGTFATPSYNSQHPFESSTTLSRIAKGGPSTWSVAAIRS
nr:hypothetical protein 8D4.160 [imported] - Neurospora crassa [Neurospora crassa]